MDRNQLIGLTLISVMLITYTQFFAPQLPVKPITTQEVSTNVPALSQEEAPQATTPSVASLAQYGPFAPAMRGTEREVVLENEVMKVTLSSRGGRIKEVILKNYQNHHNQPLTLLDGQSSDMGFQLSTQGKQFNTNDLFFATAVHKPTEEEGEKVIFTSTVGPGRYIRHTFTLPHKGYKLGHAWEMVGLKDVLDSTPVQFVWHDRIKRVEKDVKAGRRKTTINYYGADGKFAHLKEQSEKPQERLLQDPIQWVSIKQRFFTAGIISEQAFAHGHVAMTPTPQDADTVKEAQVSLTLPDSDKAENKQGQFTFYFGPNDYQVLKHVTKGFSKNIYLGWPVVRWINQLLIIPVFSFLEQYISNYGII
ncbi:MAG: membrane protein insertase YidC, partial [Bacteroidota bacterium]